METPSATCPSFHSICYTHNSHILDLDEDLAVLEVWHGYIVANARLADL
jgi:hypothetical protein